ncbi:MAG: hypothetical protein IID34_17180, partial [Planctomycetes bacterium]|nr:hypothetical protein [Planctomycetota bacterium]
DATSNDEFLHGDLIRSTMMTTDDSGAVNDRMAYTAFGELVTSSGIGGELPAGFPRYAYAGGWGYESHLLVLHGAPGTKPIVFDHVVARWYQPDTGRFIMRDPIGIAGALNVYEYVLARPTFLVDADGLDPDGEGGFKWWKWIAEKTVSVVKKIFSKGAPRAVSCLVPIAKGLSAVGNLGPILKGVKQRIGVTNDPLNAPIK